MRILHSQGKSLEDVALLFGVGGPLVDDLRAANPAFSGEGTLTIPDTFPAVDGLLGVGFSVPNTSSFSTYPQRVYASWAYWLPEGKWSSVGAMLPDGYWTAKFQNGTWRIYAARPIIFAVPALPVPGQSVHTGDEIQPNFIRIDYLVIHGGSSTAPNQSGNSHYGGTYGVGTVWQPKDVSGALGPIGASILPAIPGFLAPGLNPADLVTSGVNLATALYTGLAPGAAPPPSGPAGLAIATQFLQTAASWISQYGIGSQIPPGVKSPLDVTQWIPAIAGLVPAVIAAIQAAPGSLGSPPSWATPTQWQNAVAYAAAFFKNALGSLPSVPTDLGPWIAIAQNVLRSYGPGETLAKDAPPSPPPPVKDCGNTGYHWDPASSTCVKDPGQPHIGGETPPEPVAVTPTPTKSGGASILVPLLVVGGVIGGLALLGSTAKR